MKRKLMIIPFCLLLLFSACNDWLDVIPEDEITEDGLFETGFGYRSALNGVYKTLSSAALYGKQMSWGILDAMGQYYYTSATAENDIRFSATYDFEHYSVKPNLENIWSLSYNAVANCNNIIQHIKGAPSSLFDSKEEERNIIFGEALALRAIIHFDLLRLFAPSPAMGGRDKKVIPYKTEYPSHFSSKLTVEACLDSVIYDLKAAQTLLAGSDTILDQSFRYDQRFKESEGTGQFFSSRGFRVNYYAVSALLARVYLYCEEYDKALIEVEKVFKYNKSSGYLSFTRSSSISYNSNMKLCDDVIAAWFVKRLTDWDRSVNTIGGNNEYFLALLNVDQMFPTSNDQRYDYRFRYLLEYYDNWYYLSLKNRSTGKTNTEAKISETMIPLIRMSELYYIAAECEFKKGNYETATQHLTTVKKGRGISNVDLGLITQEETFYNILLEEARREFIGEGQIFFMHKRLKRDIPGNRKSIPIDNLIIPPLPDSETVL